MNEAVADSVANDAAEEDSAAAGTSTEESVNTHGEHDRGSWANAEESGKGLLDGTETETSPNFNADPAQVADPSKAPAPVERPRNIPKQFWDDKKGEVNGDAMATSYNDLRKQFNKMTQENGKAPEDFEAYLEDFKPPVRARATGGQKEGDPLDRLPELDPKDQLFVSLAKEAKNINISKGQFDDLVPGIMKIINDILPEPFNAEKEMALLGENGPHMVKTNKEWIDRLASNGVVNENQYNLLLKFGSTAEGVLLTNALRMDNGEKPIPVKAAVATGRKTPDECAAMLADPRYHDQGPAGDSYREEVAKQFALTHGTEPA